MPHSLVRSIMGLWLAWVLILLGFQSLVDARLQPNRPDRATEWTDKETARTSQRDKPYLMESFMNRQVSWDSEFYLAIATEGYDSPQIRLVKTPEGDFSMSYAFFPLYPLLMSVVRLPLLAFGLTPIGASALAGVLVATLGTLAALLALADIVRARLGDEGALRACFFLLAFPSAFFLAQVYTEGLFIGLAFGSLALMERKRWLWAGLLAALATLTRSIGVFLLLPLALAWSMSLRGQAGGLVAALRAKFWQGAALLLPLLAYGLWRATLGGPFDLVQEHWFGRGAFDFGRLAYGLQTAWAAIFDAPNSQTQVYYLLELASVALAALACAFTLRPYPALTLFSLLALLIPFTSGAPQSLIRYVLAVPSLFIMLAALGRYKTFERGWTLLSILLLALQTSLFTWDMWVA
jgi:hypothetical protein